MNSTTTTVNAGFVHEMRRRWRSGTDDGNNARPRAEMFFERYPELCGDPQAAVDLVYEEFCLRTSAGEADVEADILRRFPQWAQPLRLMFDCHRVLQDVQAPAFPAAGERVGDFKLLAELARGSRGRVFLANQTGLADRPVVLKITPLDGGAEHLSLARLQHTNIVPLHSVFDDAERRLHVLCMPYFGRTTLASVLRELAGIALSQRSGADVIRVIDRGGDDDAGAAAAAGGAALQMLERVSYVQAVCWIAACIADALHFAHERGLVHLDLKPSNVLLAGDGQPMLLDFHLAREPVAPGGPVPESFGGTPPYMPPEQHAAMHALHDGRPVRDGVDRRADVYALGAILYEALGGALPITTVSPPLATLNPQVSAGLSDVVARCVAARASDRYPTGADVADDLRRHLTDQPLVGVANRSIGERWSKWRRRRPGRLRGAAAVVVAAAAVGVLAIGAWTTLRDRGERARQALDDGERQIASRNYVDARRTFERGIALAQRLPFEDDLARQLRGRLDAATRLDLAEQLRNLADELRLLYVSDAIGRDHWAPLAARCDALWQKREAIFSSLPAAAADLQDVAIFSANLHAKSGEHDKALRTLDEAEAMFGPSVVLMLERQSCGGTEVADRELRSSPSPPRSVWERLALGRSRLSTGDLSGAAQPLADALALDPSSQWANFYYGVCAYRLGRHDDAVAAFSVCIGSAPQMPAGYYNRALAYAASGMIDLAKRDVSKALELDPADARARELNELLGNTSTTGGRLSPR